MKRFLEWWIEWGDQESGAVETYTSAIIALLMIVAGIVAGLKWID